MLAALLVGGVVQLIDTLRIHRAVRARVMATSLEPAREHQLQVLRDTGLFKLTQLYIAKAIWYSGVTLVAAAVYRLVAV